MTEPSDDPLGAPHGEFRGWSRLPVWLFAASAALFVGLLLVAAAPKIAKGFESPELQPMYFGLGWFLTGLGVVVLLAGLVLATESFEVREQGVRHRRLFRTKEMTWDDIVAVNVDKDTVYHISGSWRKSRYRIKIRSDDETISLGSTFLKEVDPVSVTKLLKLRQKAPGSGKRAAKRVAGAKPQGTDFYQETRRRLAGGDSAPAIEEWLQDQGLPAPVAAAMVDKAAAEKVQRDLPIAPRYKDPKLNKLFAEGCRRMRAGDSKDKLRTWLCNHVTAALADVLLADMREELL